MDDKLKDLAKKDDIEIPESFDIKFEETLNSLSDKKRTKHGSYQMVANILVTILVGSGVAIAVSNNKYKYIPTTGNILDSEGKIYGLDETIVQEDKYGNEIALDIQIIEERERAVVNVGGMYFLPKSEKSELKIGDKIYKNNRTHIGELEYSWGAVDVFNNINQYEEGEEIIYTIYLDDEEKLDFNLRLKKIDGVNNYEELGITSTYNNIPITAIVSENEDNLVVDFFSNIDKIYITPGKEGIDGTFPSIYMLDANGKRVSGLREIENGTIKTRRVKFDTRDTQKPYKIMVPQVIASFVENDPNIYSDEVNLIIPKDGETIEINRDVKIDITNTNINTNNNTVKLISGKRDGDKFIVNVEYPDNKSEQDYLRQVFAIEDRLFSEDSLVFAKSDFDDNRELVHTLEFDVSMFKNNIKFRLGPTIYDLKGNWEFLIK